MDLSHLKTSITITKKYLHAILLAGVTSRGQLLLTNDNSLAASAVASIYILLQSLFPHDKQMFTTRNATSSELQKANILKVNFQVCTLQSSVSSFYLFTILSAKDFNTIKISQHYQTMNFCWRTLRMDH